MRTDPKWWLKEGSESFVFQCGTSINACVTKYPNTVPPTVWSDLTLVFDEPFQVKSTTVIIKAEVDEYDDSSTTLCQLMPPRYRYSRYLS